MYFLVLSILLFSLLCFAQSSIQGFEFHTVTVFVKDEWDNPVEGASVMAFSPEWGVRYPSEGFYETDEEGKYVFVLPEGDWVFLASSGYDYAYENPGKGFFVKASAHIDSDTSLVLKPERAITVRIYNENGALLLVDELYALTPQYIPAIPPAFIGYTETGVFALHTTEDKVLVVAIKRPSQTSAGYILTGTVEKDVGTMTATPANSSKIVFSAYEPDGSLSQYWRVQFYLGDLYLGFWDISFHIPGKAEIYVTPMNVVISPQYIPPGWSYGFEPVGLSLKAGNTYSLPLGGRVRINMWVIKENTQLYLDVRDEYGNVLAFFSGPSDRGDITLAVFEEGRKVYETDVHSLFYSVGKTFSDSAKFELYADLGPLGGLGRVFINGSLYDEKRLVKFKELRSKNFIFHIPVEYFWNVSGQAREQVFINTLETLYEAIASYLGEELWNKPHKVDVRFAERVDVRPGFVSFSLQDARLPVDVGRVLLGFFAWHLGGLYIYTWAPPLVDSVECQVFCAHLAIYLGIEAVASLYGPNVRLWYWGTFLSDFFDDLADNEEVSEWERMWFIFIYLHKVYGPEIHRRFVQLWAYNTSLKNELMRAGFNVDETMITFYSYLAGKNLAGLFKIAGYRVSEERINEGLRLLSARNFTIVTERETKTVTVKETTTVTKTATVEHTSTYVTTRVVTSMETATRTVTVTVTEVRREENLLSWMLVAILAIALAVTAIQMRRKTRTITLESLDDTAVRVSV